VGEGEKQYQNKTKQKTKELKQMEQTTATAG
jgi:hypothetical protein